MRHGLRKRGQSPPVPGPALMAPTSFVLTREWPTAIVPSMTTPDLLGLSELADHLGLGYAATAQRRQRGQLPPPDFELKMGPIWRRETIEAWQRSHAVTKEET